MESCKNTADTSELLFRKDTSLFSYEVSFNIRLILGCTLQYLGDGGPIEAVAGGPGEGEGGASKEKVEEERGNALRVEGIHRGAG